MNEQECMELVKDLVWKEDNTEIIVNRKFERKEYEYDSEY